MLPPPPPATTGDPVVALRPAQRGDATELVRLRPRTLRAADRPIRLTGNLDPSGYATAPDGRRVAVATSASGGRPRITVVGVRSWSRQRTIRVPRDLGDVRSLLWARRDRLLVFGGFDALTVTVVDPRDGRTVAPARALEGFEQPRLAGQRVTLTSSTVAGTDTSVLVLDADGREARRIPVGDLSGPPSPTSDTTTPSWTVDPATGHLLGLAATSPVLVDVDPATGAATRHGSPAVGAPQQWVEGAGDATRLAFTVAADERGRSRLVTVDRRTLQPTPGPRLTGFNPAEGAGDLVLVPSSSLSSSSLKGLRAYGLDGARRWTAEPGHRTTTARRFGSVIYADVQGVGSTILSACTGRTLGRGPRRPVQILEAVPGEQDQPWFGFGGLRR